MDINEDISGLRNRLCKRLHIDEIREIANDAHDGTGDTLREDIFTLTKDGDNRVAYNAMWCLSHLPRKHTEWLRTKHNEIIDHVLVSHHDGQLRLLLTILELTEYGPTSPGIISARRNIMRQMNAIHNAKAK